jgi:hypothetical protein
VRKVIISTVRVSYIVHQAVNCFVRRQHLTTFISRRYYSVPNEIWRRLADEKLTGKKWMWNISSYHLCIRLEALYNAKTIFDCFQSGYLILDLEFERPIFWIVFINRCLRRIFRVFWPNVLSNEDLWSRANVEPVTIQIKHRKWTWSGTRYGRSKRRSRSKHSVGTHRVSESEEDQELIGGEAWRKRRGKKERSGEIWEPQQGI